MGRELSPLPVPVVSQSTERFGSWWANDRRCERAALTLSLPSPCVLQVDVGEAEPLQVVTNAPNVVRGIAIDPIG